MDELNDPQLESMLGRLSGAYPDANVAYVAVHGKVRQAKRRRAFVAGTAACALLVGVGVLAAQTGGSSGRLQPSDEGLVITVVSSQVSDTEVDASEPTTEVSSETTMVTTETTMVETTVAVTVVAGDGSGVTTSVSSSGHGNNNSTSTTATTKPSTKPTVPAGTQTTSSKGGTLTFTHDADTLTLVAATPAAGFHEDKGSRIDEPGRLRVEFTDGNVTWRIEIRLEGGKLPIETSKQG